MASKSVMKAIQNLKRSAKILSDPSKISGVKAATKQAKKAVKKKAKSLWSFD